MFAVLNHMSITAHNIQIVKKCLKVMQYLQSNYEKKKDVTNKHYSMFMIYTKFKKKSYTCKTILLIQIVKDHISVKLEILTMIVLEIKL